MGEAPDWTQRPKKQIEGKKDIRWISSLTRVKDRKRLQCLSLMIRGKYSSKLLIQEVKKKLNQ